MENWTKWRVYVNSTSKTPSEADLKSVVYGNSAAPVPMSSAATMRMEWRQDYRVSVDKRSDKVDVKRDAPFSGEFGIYDHFSADGGDEGDVVRLVPRFLFGLPAEKLNELYDEDVDKLPVVGIFSDSPRYDRIIIQAYMNIVTLSVIFLLYANNPPDSVVKTKKA